MEKTFIYVEGRDDISAFMENDVERATKVWGWTYKNLREIQPDCFLDADEMEKIFPSRVGVFMRNLPRNTEADYASLASWLNKNNRVTINFNAVGGLNASNDKRFQQALLLNDRRTKQYVSPFYSVSGPEDVLKLVKEDQLRYPLVLKPRDGSIGMGITAIETAADLSKQKRWKLMSAQNFIDSDYDWRVYVIGGVAVGAVRRGGKSAMKYDFHALASGIEKSCEQDRLVLDKIGHIACAITAVAGLEYGGCDIICDKKTGKYYALEVNTAATWEGNYQKIINVDLASELIKWVDERLSLEKEPTHVSIKKYIDKRLKYLPSRIAKRYLSILDGTECSRAGNGKDLTSRLHRCYDRLVTRGDNLVEAKCLIDEVEGMPLCWAGNFIGSATWGEDGVLEDGCIPSAYYLAIREKYDIMAQVKSKD